MSQLWHQKEVIANLEMFIITDFDHKFLIQIRFRPQLTIFHNPGQGQNEAFWMSCFGAKVIEFLPPEVFNFPQKIQPCMNLILITTFINNYTLLAIIIN